MSPSPLSAITTNPGFTALIAVAGRGSYHVREFPAERKKIDIGDYYSDWRLIQETLGWRPRTGIRAALQKTYAYYRRELPHYL